MPVNDSLFSLNTHVYYFLYATNPGLIVLISKPHTWKQSWPFLPHIMMPLIKVYLTPVIKQKCIFNQFILILYNKYISQLKNQIIILFNRIDWLISKFGLQLLNSLTVFAKIALWGNPEWWFFIKENFRKID